MWFLTRKRTKRKRKNKGHREGRHRKKTVTVETLHRHIYSIEETSESSEDEATSSFELRSINAAVSSDVETGQSVSHDDEEISDNTALDDAPVEQIDLAQIQEDDEDTFNIRYEKALRPSIPSKEKRRPSRGAGYWKRLRDLRRWNRKHLLVLWVSFSSLLYPIHLS